MDRLIPAARKEVMTRSAGTASSVATSAAQGSRPELALVLTIARVELGSREQALLRDLLAGALDWEYLRALAGWHGLTPLLFHHLSRYGREAVPHESLQALREECKEIAQRSLILAARLQAVSAHLRSRKIEHIAFKGPLLAEVYYGNCALRVSHDLDLIVPEAKVEAARDALVEIGFRDKYGFTAAQQAASFGFGFEHPFAAAGGLELDLHWGVVPSFISRSFDMAGSWQRVTTARFFDSELPSFCPEDLLVALCLHAGQHEWIQLSHFCDMAELLRAHPQLDWEIVRTHLGDSNTTRIVFVSLQLLRRHWQVLIPGEMLARIAADPHAERLADRVEAELWPSPGALPLQSNLRWLLDRSAGEAVGERLRILIGIVLIPTLDDFALFKLPRILLPLYPALRAMRLAGKYLSSRRRA